MNRRIMAPARRSWWLVPRSVCSTTKKANGTLARHVDPDPFPHAFHFFATLATSESTVYATRQFTRMHVRYLHGILSIACGTPWTPVLICARAPPVYIGIQSAPAPTPVFGWHP